MQRLGNLLGALWELKPLQSRADSSPLDSNLHTRVSLYQSSLSIVCLPGLDLGAGRCNGKQGAVCKPRPTTDTVNA